MRLFSKISVLVLLVFIVACGKERNFKEASAVSSYDNRVVQEINEETKKTSANSPEKVERKLIKKGDLAFETDDLKTTREKVNTAVTKFNGYISSEQQYNSGSRLSTDIQVRIPSDKFDAFLAEISSDVSKFDTKNITVNDVTEQFLDVQARLQVKKELEKRYTELLKRAKSVKEVLQVEKELTIVRSDIESMEGRLNYLQNQVSFSTLDIRFYKVTIVTSSGTSFWKKLANAFLDGIDGVKIFFLGLVTIWPFILLIVLVVFIIRRKLKKRKK